MRRLHNFLAFVYILFLTLTVIAGCSRRDEFPILPDANLPAWRRDAGPTHYPDMGMPDIQIGHPCNAGDAGTLSDPYNCGVCGNVCDPRVSDNCTGGRCWCGIGVSCDTTQECRYGTCRDGDLTGHHCEFDGECNSGFGCIRGNCSRIQCVPEVCDGIDNDCNGRVDDAAAGPLTQWCYDTTIPGMTLLHPPCTQGFQICTAGLWGPCRGAVGPVPEAGLLACNGVDDNCDGCIDGQFDPATGVCVPNTVLGFDVVYALDISGSMSDKIAAVVMATTMFSTRFALDPTFQFGLVVFPRPESGATVLQSLTDFTTFNRVLSGVTASGGSNEASWDVPYELATVGEPLNTAIMWRPGTIHIIVMFTDEMGQSYRTPMLNETGMCAGLTHGEALTVVTLPAYRPDFDACSTYFQLTTDAVMMTAELATIISDPCTATP